MTTWATLTPRQQKVLMLRFGMADGHKWTRAEVGREFNVSWQRIRQLEEKALGKLAAHVYWSRNT